MTEDDDESNLENLEDLFEQVAAGAEYMKSKEAQSSRQDLLYLLIEKYACPALLEHHDAKGVVSTMKEFIDELSQVSLL